MQIINRLLLPPFVFAVEIYDTELAGVKYNLIKAKIKNQEVVEVVAKPYNSIELLKEELIKNKAKALFMLVNTRQVLEKVVSFSGQWNKEDVLKQYFPSMDVEQLYIKHALLNQTALLSIVRREYLNELLDAFSDFWVIEVGLGKNGLLSILPFYEKKDRIFQIHDEVVDFTKDKISISTFQESLNEQQFLVIDQIRLEEKFLPLFSFLLQKLSDFESLDTYEKIKDTKEDFFFQRITNRLKLPLLLFFLGVLLLNFWYYNTYSEKLKKHAGNYESLLVNEDLVAQVKGKIAERKKLLNNVKGLSQTQNAKFLDSLGMTVPSGITIKSLNLHPLKSYNLTSNKTIDIEYNSLVIKGEAFKLEEIMDWYQRMDALLGEISKIEINHIIESDSLVFFELKAVLE